MRRDNPWLSRAAHLFLPNKCMFCGAPVDYEARRCTACEEAAQRLAPALCPICGREWAECVCHRPFAGMAAPFYYEMGADKAVRDLKFRGNLLNARKLGDDMAEYLLLPELPSAFREVDAVIPVPLLPSDQRRRGYNQARELAARLCGRLGIPLWPRALEKTRRTARQHELSAAQRRVNLLGAYRAARPERIVGKAVLLVDDVFTTGSTMEICASALLRAGAERVYCLTAAKTRAAAPVRPPDGEKPGEAPLFI